MLVRIEWNPSPKELRSFGAVSLVGFGVIAAVMTWRHRPTAALAAGAIAVVFGLTGLSGTRAALPFYRAWMGVAWVMGNISGRVILVLTWLLAVVPAGLIARASGRDRMRLKRAKGEGESYWTDLPPAPRDPAHWERLF
ncbi:MAG: hypothetical protein KA978_13620 [Deltaproteobacteria bacterium]|jgi:hypothetical protein|nr:hypothetical protein [Deltaproteobacteria bacterium]